MRSAEAAFLHISALPVGACPAANSSYGRFCAFQASALDRTKPPPRPSKRPYGYWKSRANIHKELDEYVQASGNPSAMPTERELVAAGRRDLAGAIRRQSSWRKIADEMNLVLSSIARPRSLNLVFCTHLKLGSGRMRPYMYWRDFQNVRNELNQFMAEQCQANGKDGGHPCDVVLPTATDLERAGRSDLVRAIGLHGGWEAVSSTMKMQTRYRNNSAVWNEFSNVETEVRRIISSDPTLSSTVMPSLAVLKEAGAPGLHTAIARRYGGASKVAERLGLSVAVARKPRGYWTSLENRKREVARCVRLICTKYPERDAGLMPTKSEFAEIGRSDVARALMRYGGFQLVAEALKLQMGDSAE